MCRRVLTKFLTPPNWNQAAARAITNEVHSSDATENTTTASAASPCDDRLNRVLDFIFSAGDLGRTFDKLQVNLYLKN